MLRDGGRARAGQVVDVSMGYNRRLPAPLGRYSPDQFENLSVSAIFNRGRPMTGDDEPLGGTDLKQLHTALRRLSFPGPAGAVRWHLFGPSSPVAGATYRTLMAAAIPRLALRREAAGTRAGYASRALARALRTTAFGRVPPDEQAWVRRIEGRRRELASEPAAARPWIPEVSNKAEGEAVVPVPVQAAAPWVSLPREWCLFLMRLVRELAPRSCLELGTGFGVSGAYQAAALALNGGGKLVTLEAAEEYAEIAEQGFSSLGLEQRAVVRVGRISDTLGSVLAQAAPIDYALLDADHTEQGTVGCFRAILPHLSEGAIVVFDDIGWTAEMKRAWAAIRDDPRVSTAVGFRRVGVAVI
jgi:predicted O-methyltransferase YrrM